MASYDNNSRYLYKRLAIERANLGGPNKPEGDHIYSKDKNTMTKRKKDEDNVKEGNLPIHKRACMDHTWSQTSATVTIELMLTGYKHQDIKKISTKICDNSVCVVLPDGREWSCLLYGEVKREASKVIVDNFTMKVTLPKKSPLFWARLEAKTSESDPVDHVADGDPGQVLDDTSPSIGRRDSNTYYLHHTKHDFIEQDSKFDLKIFVKSVGESVRVEVEEQALTVMFQTRDAQYLSLHQSTNKDTTFIWSIKLKGKVDPDQCTFTPAAHYISIILYKQLAVRWGSLEASSVNATNAFKVNVWLPLGERGQGGDTGQEKCDPQKDPDGRDTGEEEGDSGLGVIKKPTCMVSPLNKVISSAIPDPGPAQMREEVVARGFTGLDNLGNTCFMNSVLQALVNTREFRDYFLGSHYKQDINTNNPLGSGGRLAIEFALLSKYLWAGRHYSYAPSKLKSLVAMKASQFTGYAQHDAQEFMAFLLDGLHEDLNRVKQKPYLPTAVDTDGRADDIVADESWELYKKRNDSFVVDLFQGQYKSKLVCPVCSKVSITFDPFLYLQVPLPKKRRLFPVIFMSKDPRQKPVKMILRLPKEAGVDELKEMVSRKTGVRSCDMRIFEAYKGKIHKVFGRNSDLSSVQLTDHIFVCEVLSEEVAGENVYEIAVIQRTVMPNEFPVSCSYCKKLCSEGAKLKRCTKCYKVGYCEQSCQKSHWVVHKSQCMNTPGPVGCPFVISLPESKATYARLCQLMEAFARYSVDVFQPPVKTEKPSKKMSSELSSSSLSSSQSRGSQSSLDSQSSSASSTCTLTADDARGGLDDESLHDDGRLDHSEGSHDSSYNCGVSAAAVGSPTPSLASIDSSPDHALDPPDESVAAAADYIGNGRLSPGRPDPDYFCESTGCGSLESSHDYVTKTPEWDGSENGNKPSTSSADKSSSSTIKSSDTGFKKPIPTNVVHGVRQTEATAEKCTPAYFVKLVSQYGEGIKGDSGGTLQDKGDEPLDLHHKNFLSMDWKNNDRLTPYVLIQSKPLECEEDSTMQTEYIEENGNMKLSQCLTLFTEPEILSPDEAWYCPQCKEHREATKQMSLWRLPPTLIIQLKRFSFRNFIWRDKIDKLVEFPTRGLNLCDYYVGPSLEGEEPPIYDLYAVINHHGGILGGHYTAYVRCPDTTDGRSNDVGWRLCDDSRVTRCDEASMVSRSAYVLFYRQRHLNLTVPPSDDTAATRLGDDAAMASPTSSVVTATVAKSDCYCSRVVTTEATEASGLYTDMDAID